MRGTVVATASAILLLPALVLGQDPVTNFDQLNTRLKVGETVYVTDTQGREREGKILELSVSSLTLDNRVARQKLAVGEVQLVQTRQRDSLLNGALIGLTIGAGVGAGLVAASKCDAGDCYDTSGAEIFIGGVCLAAGVGIGLVADAAHPGKKRVIYRAPGGSPSARVMFTPVVTPRMKRVALSFSF
jgi:hypothetical protein